MQDSILQQHNMQLYILLWTNSLYNLNLLACLNNVSIMHIQTEHVHTSRVQFLENDGKEYWDWIRRQVLNSLVWVGALRAEKDRKLKHCLRWIMQFQGLSGKGATHFIAYIFRGVRKVACMSFEYFISKFSKLICHRSSLRPCGS